MAQGRYRLQGFDYRAARWYFVTTVTVGRSPVLGEVAGTEFHPSPLGKIVEEELAALVVRRPNVQLPITAILPNHVHLLVGLANEGAFDDATRFGKVPSDSLSTVIGGWKSGVKRRAGQELRWPEAEIWQRRFHDRVVRNVEEWEAIASYIQWNVVNWGLDPLSGSREPTDKEIYDWKRRLNL